MKNVLNLNLNINPKSVLLISILLLQTGASISQQKNNNDHNYCPTSCNVTNYDFTFIYDERDQAFKVHGLWAEQCEECLTCGYPSCCDTGNMSYANPTDPSQIQFLNTRWYDATTREECGNNNNNNGTETETEEVSLFEHEFYKHASCTNFRNTSDFLVQVALLYDAYYKTLVENQCAGFSQLWLNLDTNFAYNNVTKCL